MSGQPSPLSKLRTYYQNGGTPELRAIEAERQATQGATERPIGETYVWRTNAVAYAATLPEKFPDTSNRPLLYGVPVSIKDCFDLAGAVTGCGSKFYAENNPICLENAWIVERLLSAGAVITGKTHLQQLAYGITGENEDYGDSLQPRDRTLLTGGSSSGACASVQEGSALVAVGTDTGGSIRVPAALCGLAGYRASHELFPEEICWRGGAHLAPSFDTLGLIFQDLRDGPLLGHALFDLPLANSIGRSRIGYAGGEFLTDCETDVVAAYTAWKQRLASQSHVLEEFGTEFWAESVEVFTTIQASEAAVLHAGRFEYFEKQIAQRLTWGASLSIDEVAAMRGRQASFCQQMNSLFERYEFLALPCAPVGRLRAGEDQSGARKRILRYTAPISLAGLPVVTLPSEAIGSSFGTGIQLCAAQGRDAELLAFASRLIETSA